VKSIVLEEKIALCEDYTRQWGQFFNFFGDGLEGREVTREHEAQFFRLMTELARKQFALCYHLADELKGAEQIIAIVNSAVSMDNLQRMTEAQFSKFQHEWHVVFIALNKCLGRLLQKRPVPKPAKPAKGAPS
jgi:hypothetical protein